MLCFCVAYVFNRKIFILKFLVRTTHCPLSPGSEYQYRGKWLFINNSIKGKELPLSGGNRERRSIIYLRSEYQSIKAVTPSYVPSAGGGEIISCVQTWESCLNWISSIAMHIGSRKVSSVRRSVSWLSRFELRMRAILLLCQSVGHISEVLKYQMKKNLCLLLFQYFHA